MATFNPSPSDELITTSCIAAAIDVTFNTINGLKGDSIELVDATGGVMDNASLHELVTEEVRQGILSVIKPD